MAGKQLLQICGLILVATANVVEGATGFDSAVSITVTKFQNTLAAGYTFFIGQYYNGGAVSNPNSLSSITTGVNTNGITSIKNARNASYTTLVDAYHIPVYTVSAPMFYNPWVGWKTNIYAQVRYPIDRLNAGGAAIGRTWVVVSRNVNSRWSSNQADNRAYMTEFLSYLPTPLQPQAGILTNLDEFQAIFGTSYVPVDSSGAQVQLWWQNCNGNQDYTGFVPFNGWTTPVMHQYQCSVSNIAGQSGVNGNLNWFA